MSETEKKKDKGEASKEEKSSKVVVVGGGGENEKILSDKTSIKEKKSRLEVKMPENAGKTPLDTETKNKDKDGVVRIVSARRNNHKHEKSKDTTMSSSKEENHKKHKLIDSERSHIEKSELDRKDLNEFLQLMDDWQKVATGNEPSPNAPPKRDVRTFANACGKSLVHFAGKNGLMDQPSSSRILEVAHTTSRAVTDQRAKAQELLLQHTNAFHMCGSISQMIRLILQVLVQFYHGLSSDVPFPPDAVYQNFVSQSLKASYLALEGSFGWTLDEEMEVYGMLPVKGEFPKVEYRVENYEEFSEKLLSDMARPATERLHTLPALLRRFQGEYAFRTMALSAPKIDASAILRSAGVGGGDDVQAALAAHVATEIRKMYGAEDRGGNLFGASRAALCFLMHAQTVLDVVCNMPMFGPLVESAKGSRHKLDLLKNIPLASAHQTLNEPLAVSELDAARRRVQAMSYDSNKTIADMHKEIESKKMLQCHPRTDLVHALVAMFFDAPLAALKSDLERQLLDIQLSPPSFYVSSLHFAPLFIHQDTSFLQEYFAKNPGTDYSQAFLTFDEKKEKRKKDEEGVNKESKEKRYAPENGVLKKLGENAQKVVTLVHQMNTVDPKDNAKLLSGLLRLYTGPDLVGYTQSTSDPSIYDEKWISYVNKRTITAGSFEMMRHTLRSMGAYAYPYTQPQHTPAHQQELLHRYTSLLLGYPRAYAEQERPADKWYLGLDYVIPFLYRNRQAICDPSKGKEIRVLGFEYDFYKSPLVQVVFKAASTRPLKNFPPSTQIPIIRKSMATKLTPFTDTQTPAPQPSTPETTSDEIPDAHTLIQQLYSLWEESKQDPAGELNHFIFKLITGHRYEHVQVREALKNHVEKAEAEVGFWVKVEKQVESFMSFLRKYEVALSDSTPLPDHLCPVVTSTRSTPFEEDVQLLMEVF